MDYLKLAEVLWTQAMETGDAASECGALLSRVATARGRVYVAQLTLTMANAELALCTAAKECQHLAALEELGPSL